MWALNTLFFNPCKNISLDAFLGAVRVLESYDRYYATHPHPNANFKPICQQIGAAFKNTEAARNFDPAEAERIIQDVLNTMKTH
jgi:hypothetical protein